MDIAAETLLPLLFSTARNISSIGTLILTRVLSESSPLRQLFSGSPDLYRLAALVAAGWLGLMVLSMATRWIYSLVVMVMRLVCVVAIALVGLWVYAVGMDEAAAAGAALVGRLRGEGAKGRQGVPRAQHSGRGWAW